MQLYVCHEMSRKNWLCVIEIKKWWSMFEAFWLQSVIHGRLTTSNAFLKQGPSPCDSRLIPSSFASFSFYLSCLHCLHFFQYDTHYVSLCEIILYIQLVNLPFRSGSCHSLFTCFMPIKTWKRTTFVGDSGISPDAAVPVRQSWQISDGVQSFRLPNSVWPFAWIQEEVMLWLNSNMNYFILFSYINFHSYSTKMETCVFIVYNVYY